MAYPSDRSERTKMLVAEGKMGGKRYGSGPRGVINQLRAVLEKEARYEADRWISSRADWDSVAAMRELMSVFGMREAEKGEIDELKDCCRLLYELTPWKYPHSVKVRKVGDKDFSVELIHKKSILVRDDAEHPLFTTLLNTVLERKIVLREALDIFTLMDAISGTGWYDYSMNMTPEPPEMERVRACWRTYYAAMEPIVMHAVANLEPEEVLDESPDPSGLVSH